MIENRVEKIEDIRKQLYEPIEERRKRGFQSVGDDLNNRRKIIEFLLDCIDEDREKFTDIQRLETESSDLRDKVMDEVIEKHITRERVQEVISEAYHETDDDLVAKTLEGIMDKMKLSFVDR
jgi:hypothetical protein